MTGETDPHPAFDSDVSTAAVTDVHGASGEALSVAVAEARETLDEQLTALTAIDTKALQLLQFTVALLGVAVSGLSLLEADLGPSINPYLGGGMALLVLGAVTAVGTYAVTPRIVGIDPDGLARCAGDATERAFRRALVRGYADWIRFNRYVNRRGALLVTTVLLLVLGGTLGLVLGVLRLLVGPLSPLAPLGALAAMAAAAYATRIHRQLRRFRAADRPTRPGTGGREAASLDGQEVFAGEHAEDLLVAGDGADESG